MNIKETIIAYIPTLVTVILTIFMIVRTIKGLNLVDAAPHVERLSKNLEIKYSVLMDKFRLQEEKNFRLEQQIIENQKRAEEAESKLIALESSINDKFAHQTDLLTKIITEDVEMRADMRRIKDDSKAI